MDTKRLLALLWLAALACGRRTNDEHAKPLAKRGANKNLSANSSDAVITPRSYGFKDEENDYPSEYSAEVNDPMPRSTLKSGMKKNRKPEMDDYGEQGESEQPNEPEKKDSFERFNEPEKLEDTGKDDDDNDDFERVKKVKEISSIISLKPKERNKALDPISDQQGYAPQRIVRPLRDLSIIIRNRKHPLFIGHQVPVHWVPRGNHHHPHHHRPQHPGPHKPHPPSMPKHKPCKPCKPKVHKKHHHPHHKPKKPKKKPKKEHCHNHHTPKKPHHKKLIYYAPMPTAVNYFYGAPVPARLVGSNDGYDVQESPENDDLEADTEKPFHQEVEDDVEEHRLADLGEPFDEVDPAESKTKPSKKPQSVLGTRKTI